MPVQSQHDEHPPITEQKRLFQQLIQEKRYREARGILETGDFDAHYLEKWGNWLYEVQKAERQQIGISTDDYKKGISPAGEQELVHSAVLVTAALLTALLTWGLVVRTFTGSTASVELGLGFVFLALICGYLGWQKLLRAAGVSGGASVDKLVSIFIVLLALIFIQRTGIPFRYVNEPPLQYLLVGFALVAPQFVVLGWRGADWSWKIVHRWKSSA